MVTVGQERAGWDTRGVPGAGTLYLCVRWLLWTKLFVSLKSLWGRPSPNVTAFGDGAREG